MLMIIIYDNFRTKEQPVVKQTLESCLVQKKMCKIITDEYDLKVSLLDKIEYLKPFDIFISSEVKGEIRIKSIKLNFIMVDMDMGKNIFELKTNYMNEKNQTWAGKGMLPLCVTGKKSWLMMVDVLTNKTRYNSLLPLTIE